MAYYVGILDGASDAWGVRIADIDGCVGAGDTPETALADATAALRDVIAYKRSGGHPVPPPSSVAEVLARGEIGPGETAVLVPLILDAGRSVRANLTMDAGLLEAIDEAASRSGVTRSAFIASAAREKLARV
ncbi:Predicted nuclease of the RNAse H fold, HicB family [Rhodoblastus acidophilus]|uniref:Predicted nuclease of the RNAse H fold, HicB family n=1 Tax=Rhodoblastus acidophilus TaxID=1074 RepID=A0A212S2K4_RHOAC|nr:type II toxin-antitoxin system HicB family antitoxin [Rhodoblastus acidophilus]MCW2319159.1 putative RNase H-like HicB family nuclease [Rhodoblastus acidophilus]PPQ37648.1 DNA-binding protein [Rhodoblastus acidophilus]RAI19093.1 DNA-binding protein [Rhodoblastus acidophilus]SNB79337.1 Predicted nuclease of the RNAse H fold, HicB family [Rhodoblastus acidophilus]